MTSFLIISPGLDLTDFIFLDRFNRPDSGTVGDSEQPGNTWSEAQPSGTAEVKDSQLKLTAGAVGIVEAQNTFADQQANTSFTFKTLVTKTGLDGNAGVSLRIAASSFSVAFRLAAAGQQIQHFQGGGWNQIGAETWASTTPFLLEARCNGATDKYDVRIDGVQKLTGQDMGSLGLAITEVELDQSVNMQILELNDMMIYDGIVEPLPKSGLLHGAKLGGYI